MLRAIFPRVCGALLLHWASPGHPLFDLIRHPADPAGIPIGPFPDQEDGGEEGKCGQKGLFGGGGTA